MNGREGYITTEISQRMGDDQEGTARKEREAQSKEGGSCVTERGVGPFPSSSEGPFSLGRWAARFCVLFIPKTSHRLIRAQFLDPLSTNSM